MGLLCLLRDLVKSELLDGLFIKTWNNSCSMDVEMREIGSWSWWFSWHPRILFYFPLNVGENDGVGEKFLFSAYWRKFHVMPNHQSQFWVLPFVLLLLLTTLHWPEIKPEEILRINLPCLYWLTLIPSGPRVLLSSPAILLVKLMLGETNSVSAGNSFSHLLFAFFLCLYHKYYSLLDTAICTKKITQTEH